MSLAFEGVGARRVYSNEWDKFCRQTFLANFGEIPDDVARVDASTIPDHDILVAGFIGSPFSIAGIFAERNLGRATESDDKSQRTLFLDVCRVIHAKRPKAFVFEFAKNLPDVDRGITYKIVLSSLYELDYEVFDQILDGRLYVPQHRERTLIVGFDRKRYGMRVDFTFDLTPPAKTPVARDILESAPDDKYTLSDKKLESLQGRAPKRGTAGDGVGCGIVDLDGCFRTLSARYCKDGSEILIPQPGKNPRKLTPRECARLQGFPDDFVIPVSDTQAYKQFGNSVVPPLMRDVARLAVEKLEELDSKPAR